IAGLTFIFLLAVVSLYPFAQYSVRSEEHTSELQSLTNLVCRLLLEKNTRITCYLRHCAALVEHLEQRLGINRGETTADGNYTLLFFLNVGAPPNFSLLPLHDAFPI